MSTWKRLRGEKTRARRLRELIALVRPYKWRVALMFVSMIDRDRREPRPAVPREGRDRQRHHRQGLRSTLDARRRALSRSALILWGATYVQTYMTELGRPEGAAGPAPHALRSPAEAVVRLLLAPQDRRARLAPDQRCRGARPARQQRRDDALPVGRHADRDGRDPAVAERSAGARLLRGLPDRRAGELHLPRDLNRRLPRDARTNRRRHGVPAGDDLRRLGRPRVRPRRTPRRRVHRALGNQPRRQHALGLPERCLLPGDRVPLGDLDGRDPPVRWLPRDRRQHRGRRARAVRRLHAELLRSDPAALAALHDLPIRHGRARQDLRPAGRGARRHRPARARAELGPVRGAISFEDVWFSYAETRRRRTSWALRGIDLAINPGETVALVGATGAGKSTFAKLVPRFYDPQKRPRAVDGHDLRDVDSRSLRRQLGYVPQEGYLFSGSIADNIEFGKPGADARRDRGRRALGRRVRPDRRAARRIRHGRRRARQPPFGRSAPAGRVRARADRRAATADPRRGHRERRREHRDARSKKACADCSPAARRSSSPTASRRSSTRRASRCSKAARSSRSARTTNWSPPAAATPSSTRAGSSKSPKRRRACAARGGSNG